MAASAACRISSTGSERRAAHVVGLADADDRRSSAEAEARPSRSREADATGSRCAADKTKKTETTPATVRRPFLFSPRPRSAEGRTADCIGHRDPDRREVP